MLYREIIAVCSEIHTKHINTVCGQNAEFVNVNPPGAKGLKNSIIYRPILVAILLLVLTVLILWYNKTRLSEPIILNELVKGRKSTEF